MPIPFRCPYCGHETLVEDQYAGRSGPCVQCGQTITVPYPQQTSPPMAGSSPQQAGMGGAVGTGPMFGPSSGPTAPARRSKSSVSPTAIAIIIGSSVLLIVALALLIGGLSGGGTPQENRETARPDVAVPTPVGKAVPSGSSEPAATGSVPGAHNRKGGGGFTFAPRSIFDRRAIQASGPEMQAQCCNNLKRIGLALHAFYDRYHFFPPSRYEDPNQPSWRTAILPYLDEQSIARRYEREGLTVPWDDPRHAQTVALEIDVFRCPAATELPANGTSYVRVVGPGTMGEIGKKITFGDIRDGTSNTIFVVEWPYSRIPWAKPEDITVDEFVSLFGGSESDEGINVLLVDGSFLFLPFSTPREKVQAALTIAGGEPSPLAGL
ncbi:hypothetical protein JCM19992_10400 [Thermostilla marina]